MRGETPWRTLLWFAGASGAGAVVVAALGLDAQLSAAGAGMPDWLTYAAHNWTALGSLAVLALVLVAAAAFLLLRRQTRLAALLVVSVAAGEGVMELVKRAVLRLRPQEGAAETFGASFPSGHAMMAALVYLTMGAMLARAEADAATRRYLLGLAIGVAVLVGTTRVMLGVHWPTDVLAGWCLGALWAAGGSALAARLQCDGAAEPPG